MKYKTTDIIELSDDEPKSLHGNLAIIVKAAMRKNRHQL
jgi:hypothetical protein